MKTALLASYEKDEALTRLGRLLIENGWTLLCSAGTAKFLMDNTIPCRDVAGIVGPPILGHRVVTLAREVYAGLLSATEDDDKEIRQLGIARIDLVYVTLYPLEATIADPASTQEDIIEKTDIGGPTLLRAAAKGRRLALCSPEQIDMLESWIKAGSPEKDREAFITHLAAVAERRVADYVAASASYWEQQTK